MYLTAFEQDPVFVFPHLPEGVVTPNICLRAVSESGELLGKVSDGLKTPEVCLAAVKQKGEAIRSVPEYLKDHEVCVVAIKNLKSTPIKDVLSYIPDGVKSPTFWVEAILEDLDLIHLAPEQAKTDPRVKLERAYIDPTLLTDLPQDSTTQDLVMQLIARGTTLDKIPCIHHTSKVIDAAVSHNGLNLQWVEDQFRTAERCVLAVTRVGRALQFVPEQHLSGYLSMLAVKGRCGSDLQYVPTRFLTEAICLEAVKATPTAIQYVPEDVVTDEMRELAEGSKNPKSPCTKPGTEPVTIHQKMFAEKSSSPDDPWGMMRETKRVPKGSETFPFDLVPK